MLFSMKFSLACRSKSWFSAVCQSVCQCVQGLLLVGLKRLVRSGPGWYHSTRPSAGTTMAMVPGRSAARGTCHVPPREPLQKFVVTATGQTAGGTGVPLTGCMPPTVNLDPLGVASPRGARCTCKRRVSFLTGDPLSSGNGELETPKLAH